MKTEKLFAVLIASAVLQTMAVSAQDQLFNITFSGSARPGNDGHAVMKLTTQDLVEQCVGTDTTAKEIRQNFALVYNATQDSVQVVNRADGSVVCDLFHFDGGTSTVKGNRLDRLAFVFEHDQTEASGSAAITEKSNGAKTATRPHIAGKMQFTLPLATPVTTAAATTVTTDVTNSDGSVTSTETPVTSGTFVQQNAVASVSTDQQVCRGSFTVGRAFQVGVPTTTSKKKKNKNTSTATETTSTETTTTDNTATITEPSTTTTTTNQTSLLTTNGTSISTNSLGTTNGLGSNTSITTLFPPNNISLTR